MKTTMYTKSQPKIHDSGYKKSFSNRTIFQRLIETFITEAWVKELDFSKCETLDKSFVTDHYKETESDFIYKLKLRRKTVYIYVLLEFQSKVDTFMGLRVLLFYILSFYMDYRANHKRVKKLPAIFPIVLYNGKRKWSAPTKISDLIEGEPSLGEYAIQFQYLLLNEKAYSKEQLLKIRNIVSTLFLAEGHYDIALLGLWPNAASGLAGLRRRLPLMPHYVQRASEIAERLRTLPKVEIVPDPPQTPMMHLHLKVEESAFLRAAAQIAESDRVFTWAGTAPGLTPSTRVVEFTVGDATLEFTVDEVATLVERLVAGTV